MVVYKRIGKKEGAQFVVHNVELAPNQGGVLARSAGSSVQIVSKEGNYAIMRLPSGEVRRVHLDCWARIGVLGKADWKNVNQNF